MSQRLLRGPHTTPMYFPSRGRFDQGKKTKPGARKTTAQHGRCALTLCVNITIRQRWKAPDAEGGKQQTLTITSTTRVVSTPEETILLSNAAISLSKPFSYQPVYIKGGKRDTPANERHYMYFSFLLSQSVTDHATCSIYRDSCHEGRVYSSTYSIRIG
jgi:hypothetical protein